MNRTVRFVTFGHLGSPQSLCFMEAFAGLEFGVIEEPDGLLEANPLGTAVDDESASSAHVDPCATAADRI